LEEEDEDIKKLLNSAQSDPLIQQQSKEIFSTEINLLFFFLATRPSSSSKRTRRCSKTSTIHDKNNEYVFDEEHLIELLKRLKQQPGHSSVPMTADDESNLFETLISRCKHL